VLYLNGSKAATSGSALTFDGTSLGVGGVPTIQGELNVFKTGSAPTLYVQGDTSNTTTQGIIRIGGASGRSASIQGFRESSSNLHALRFYSYNSADQLNYEITSGGNSIWSVGGTEGMRLTSTGLGIGTSSPTTKLNIVGSSNSLYIEVGGAVRPLRFTSFATSVADAGHKIDASSSVGAIALAVGGVEYARLDSAGNVGFATSVPLSRIDARAASAVIGNYQTIQAFSSDSAAADLGGGIGLGGYYSTTTSLAVFGNIVGRKSNGTAGNYDGYLAFGTNNTSTGVVERMRITSAGFVGIGTASPTARLDVDGQIRVNTTDNTSNVYLTNSGTTYLQLRGNTTSAFINNPTAGPMVFGTTDTERMRLTAAGALVHGVTSAQLSTSIYASGNSATDGVIGARNGSGPSTFQVVMDSNANCGYLGTSSPSGSALLRLNSIYGTQFTISGTERARISSTGNFLIGKTSGSTYLNAYTSFDYQATTFTSGAGNYGYLDLPQTPSTTLMLVNLTNQNNSNLNISFLMLVNTRSTAFGGGNGINTIAVVQGSTGTGGEISTYAFAISGSGTTLQLRATCTLVSGSAVIDFSARIIQI